MESLGLCRLGLPCNVATCYIFMLSKVRLNEDQRCGSEVRSTSCPSRRSPDQFPATTPSSLATLGTLALGLTPTSGPHRGHSCSDPHTDTYLKSSQFDKFRIFGPSVVLSTSHVISRHLGCWLHTRNSKAEQDPPAPISRVLGLKTFATTTRLGSSFIFPSPPTAFSLYKLPVCKPLCWTQSFMWNLA